MKMKVNLAEKLSLFEEYWAPRIVGQLNDYKIQVVKIAGEFVWHSHSDTDEFFLVLKGRMVIKLRDGIVELAEGDLFVIPKGVEHCPEADLDCHVLLIQPIGTPNTGDVGGDRTAIERFI